MASSSVITSIDSAFTRVLNGPGVHLSSQEDADEVKIILRNLKGLLLVSRAVKYQPPGYISLVCGCLSVLLPWLRNDVDGASPNNLASLFARIEEIDVDQSMAETVRCLEKDVHDVLSNGTYYSSRLLTVDEVVGITDSVLENAPEFLSLIPKLAYARQKDVFEAVDDFQVHMRFMKSVLVFARQVGFEPQNVLMLHIQPIAIHAARVFVRGSVNSLSYHFGCWCKKIRSKCLEVNRMATNPQLYQAYSLVLCITTPLHDIDDEILKNLLDSLMSHLWDALRVAVNSMIKDKFAVLYERLRFLRAIMKQQSISLDETIVHLICEAGVLICSFHQADPGRLSDLLQRFDVFRSQVEVVALEATPSMQESDQLGFGDLAIIDIPDDAEKVLKKQKGIITPQVSGFHSYEVAAVLDRLIGGSKQLLIVPICGMAGLGKTTFALKLYNHPSVLHHFWVHAWCPISQELDKKKVLLQLLKQIYPGDYSGVTEVDLANKLRQSLKGKTYLILLDDVWSPQVLYSLKASFPDDFTGSRIVLTSRRVDIAPNHLPGEHPHLLRLRDDSECMQAKLFDKEGWTSDLAMEVAKLCKGLPLTLVIVSGIMATTKQEDWETILDHLSSGHNVSGAEQCNTALELSYKHLPDYLKPCFLYFGAFPEDDRVSVKRLVQLWMAEGFLIKNELKRIEDVGQEYMEKLIERSLVMVEEKRSIGGAKTFRIHDLLHGFCQRKAKQENFLHLLLPVHDQLSDFIEPCNLQRLSIHSDPVDFKESRLFYPGAVSLLFCFGGYWSHLFDMSFIIQIFQLLQVLDMDRIYLINGIPNEIELLTRLRYLSIRTHFPIIPSSLGNLSNLETFKVVFMKSGKLSFPRTLWNLQKLKYLHVNSFGDGFHLPVENLESLPCLLELETLCGVIFYSDGSMEKQMEKFPNIRRLKCTIRLSRESTEEDLHDTVVPDVRTQLQSLTKSVNSSFSCGFGSIPKNLRKLKLHGFELSRKEIAVIGKLVNLKVLKLSYIHLPDHKLEMGEGEFPKLSFLRFYSCDSLETWTTCDDELPSLQKLEFLHCEYLEEIPSWLETSSMLEEIQVLRCSSALESLVRDIEQVQKDYGNLVKVLVI